MPRNTGGIRSRPNFRPGGSNYTNLSYSQDIECKDLHAFGSTVCNGESRIQGNVISGGLHVGDSGVLKVPVIAGGSVGVVPTPAPTMAGLVVVKALLVITMRIVVYFILDLRKLPLTEVLVLMLY